MEQEFLKLKIMEMIEKILNYVEVSTGNPVRYKILRAKILRIGNDCIRSVLNENDKENTLLGGKKDD